MGVSGSKMNLGNLLVIKMRAHSASQSKITRDGDDEIYIGDDEISIFA